MCESRISIWETILPLNTPSPFARLRLRIRDPYLRQSANNGVTEVASAAATVKEGEDRVAGVEKKVLWQIISHTDKSLSNN